MSVNFQEKDLVQITVRRMFCFFKLSSVKMYKIGGGAGKVSHIINKILKERNLQNDCN